MKIRKKSPRFLCLEILKIFLPETEKKFLINGIKEEFEYRKKESGKILTILWYWKEIVLILPCVVYDHLKWSITMLKNYFKTAMRNMRKNKVYSSINIVGLAIGIACSVLIMLFVRDELSYDSYFDRADQIYRIAVEAKLGNTAIAQTWTPAILPKTLLNDYPEVLEAVTVDDNSNVLVKYNDKSFNETRVFSADISFFKIFAFKFLKGDKNTALAEPFTVVITKSTALKYFGEKDPLNQTLNIEDQDYKVTGIVEDVRPNTHFHFDFILSLVGTQGLQSQNWGQNNYRTYILLQKSCSRKEFNIKLKEVVNRYMTNFYNEEGNYWIYYLQPLTEIHLNSDIRGELESNGNKVYVYLFSVISVIILILACVNFMNLTTARSAGRAREIGIRKAAGSYRSQLMKQFLFETIITCAISAFLAIFIIEAVLPYYNNFLGKQLYISYGSPLIISGFCGLILLVGLLSGIYPSVFLSSFKPAAVLRSGLSGSRKNTIFRNALVIFQFSISIILIIGTIVVYKQLGFISNSRLGFEKEGVVVVENPGYLGTNLNVFKETLLKDPSIKNAAVSHTIPGRFFNNWGVKTEAGGGSETAFTLNICITDEDFLKTMNMELAEGRFFSKDFPTDPTAIILNECAVKLLGWEKPLGKPLYVLGTRKHTVIGVVKDYFYESMRQTVKPLALLYLKGGLRSPRYVSLKIKGDNISDTMSYIKNTWESTAPGMPYSFFFFDEDYDKLYKNEKQTADVFTAFSLLALIIGSLGLFGLASYMTELRTKEIGIRKALGAAVPDILVLLVKEFIKWPLLAVLIAWPAAWFLMHKWLEDFAYRIKLGFEIFIISLLISIFAALITVSYRVIKAAGTNPVDSIKYE